ncbi:GATA transcription factor 27 [Cajanus cajan]|uniref:GATA transcription factor 27 n=1 Tax=Cajanus cajan TaxID=3821 RepID=UPI0010FB9855|nr:GATA transcription factor 27 [Cajanus cajan]XP_029125406.1 GATA transcription factor 27 [Cajanus cajan]
MGNKKHGPCFHCGINFTPLWRNGPEEKPVLCNACGSRYRKRGNLEDYLPTHFQPEYLDNLKKLKGWENPYFWSHKIPSRRRSQVVCKNITPMKRFGKQLHKMWKRYGNLDESSPEEVLLLNNVNNFIPSNEIGLGGVLLKPDDTSASA